MYNFLIKLLGFKKVRLFLIKKLHSFYTLQISDNFDRTLSYKIDCIDALLDLEN